jgi:hypothetical protein
MLRQTGNLKVLRQGLVIRDIDHALIIDVASPVWRDEMIPIWESSVGCAGD